MKELFILKQFEISRYHDLTIVALEKDIFLETDEEIQKKCSRQKFEVRWWCVRGSKEKFSQKRHQTIAVDLIQWTCTIMYNDQHNGIYYSNLTEDTQEFIGKTPVINQNNSGLACRMLTVLNLYTANFYITSTPKQHVIISGVEKGSPQYICNICISTKRIMRSYSLNIHAPCLATTVYGETFAIFTLEIEGEKFQTRGSQMLPLLWAKLRWGKKAFIRSRAKV